MSSSIPNACPLNVLFSQLSKQWVLHILHNITQGVETFSALKNNLHGISSRTLSLRLKELQEDGFIERNVISATPVKIRYTLSSKGKSFSMQMDALGKWAREWGKS